MPLDALLKQIAQAKAAAGGNYLRDGKYVLILDKLIIEDKWDGTRQSPHFIAELFVLESQNDPTAKDDKGNPVLANATGTTATFLQQLEKNPQTAFPQTKAFLLAVTGDKEEEVDEEEFVEALQGAVGKDQPLRGAMIKAETYRKVSKKSGKTLVLPKWVSVENTPELIAKNRKMLDSRVLSGDKTQSTPAA